ncbi:MAG: isopeptide-forming domain-containing fimbrial protein [Clostridia bacterium]|nr:isopeptide-forming domain-containing fimbrial protein [Clostridia bacterium]
MKNMKKLVGIIMLATALILSTLVPSFATNITISGGADGSEYAAYKLLNATDGGDGKFAYTLNEKYEAILADKSGKDTQDEIVAYIEALDTDAIRVFADNVYSAIIAANLDADATSTANTIAVDDQGYYLIAETEAGNTADTLSLVMLNTAGEDDITVTTKEDLPSVEKEVEETNDTTGATSWGESADYDIGDSINYKLTGTVSEKYASYKSYYYSFIDEMSAGLTYNGDAKVTIDGVEVTDQFTIAYDTAKNILTATANLKDLTGVAVTASSEIVVEYSATLNENAVSGAAGNPNNVYIEYENNPYHEADGDPETPDKPEEPGKSEKDIVIVFTFDAIVNKVDGGKTPLDGAGFTLYKYNETEDKWNAVENEITGVTTFRFDGLDVGIYKLVETTVPDGYNKADDVVFEIVATYDDTTDPTSLTALTVYDAEGNAVSGDDVVDPTFTVDLNKGEVATDVVNVAGTELPETGGIGTTIFYIAGGILVLAAVVLLVAKKRMSIEG